LWLKIHSSHAYKNKSDPFSNAGVITFEGKGMWIKEIYWHLHEGKSHIMCIRALCFMAEIPTGDLLKTKYVREISSSHGGEYDVQSCLLGYTAV
jgi:predicted NodU family carbamoyl transferase